MATPCCHKSIQSESVESSPHIQLPPENQKIHHPHRRLPLSTSVIGVEPIIKLSS